MRTKPVAVAGIAAAVAITGGLLGPGPQMATRGEDPAPLSAGERTEVFPPRGVLLVPQRRQDGVLIGDAIAGFVAAMESRARA